MVNLPQNKLGNIIQRIVDANQDNPETKKDVTNLLKSALSKKREGGVSDEVLAEATQDTANSIGIPLESK